MPKVSQITKCNSRSRGQSNMPGGQNRATARWAKQKKMPGGHVRAPLPEGLVEQCGRRATQNNLQTGRSLGRHWLGGKG